MPRTVVNGPEPKERIVKSARKLFFKHGYDAVSTDMIAKDARVSKSTLYSHVGDKKAILLAMVEKENERFFDANFQMPKNKKDYREFLIGFGVNLLQLLAEKDLRRFDQMMLGQAITNPDISIGFYEAAYQMTIDHMNDAIHYGQEKGYIKSTHPAELLSEILLHSWIGTPYHKAMYGFKTSEHNEPEERVKAITEIVLGL